ncbi:MAG: hypothetical protein ACOC2J_03975, partial [bacterium]
WELADGGFWSKKTYMALTETFFYPEHHTFLDQTIVLTEDKDIKLYRVYDHIYTKKSITKILDRHGLRKHIYYADVTGKEYFDDSNTIAVISRK